MGGRGEKEKRGGEKAGATEGAGEAKRRRATERDREKRGEDLCCVYQYGVFPQQKVVFYSSVSSVGSLKAAQRELERQRKEEWERRRRGELKIKREQEQDDIIRLKAKKKSLEMELEAVVSSKETYFTATNLLTSYNDALYASVCPTVFHQT